MLIFRALILVAATTVISAGAMAASPQIVPPGWHQVRSAGNTGRVFVSPDGSARIRFGHEPAQSPDRYIHRPGERVTYQDGGESWFVVSGYRGEEIYYRKGNLACRGSRWNLIEFRYPREAKRQMDATVAMVARQMGAYGRDCG
ncbi:hypothetical protein RHPLAN_56970 [Rhodoplanes sp. Z2-YC6860]|nr:hypothetical protein RHPLAN_56970 [Rhodoplanes sp. Z2-YC6860]